jgi:hypothetical protein
MEHEKCLSCRHISCADFLYKKDELEGGVLYVLNECIKQKKVVPLPTNNTAIFLLYVVQNCI